MCGKQFIYTVLEKTFWVQPSRKEGVQHLVTLDLELLQKVKCISSEHVQSIPRKVTFYSHSKFNYFPSIDDAGFQVSVIRVWQIDPSW